MYIEYIIELQLRCSAEVHKNVVIPIYFILSELTYTDIVDWLNYKKLYGLESNQIKLLKQKNVPVFHANIEVDDEKDKLKRVNLIGQLLMDKKDHQFKTVFHGKGGIH